MPIDPAPERRPGHRLEALRQRLRDEGAGILVGWQFLTRVPLPPALAAIVDRHFDDGAPRRSPARHFPTVGLGLGLLLTLTAWLAASLWPMPVAAVATVGIGLWLTGAFHEDGLADTFDALGGHVERERALAIMRDSRIGTYGAAALWTALAARVAVLATLAPVALPVALITGQAASRAVAITMMARLPYVADRRTSKVAARVEAPDRDDLVVGWTVVAVAIGIASWLAGFATTHGVGPGTALAGGFGTALFAGVLAVGAACLTGVGLAAWFRHRLGGCTGDCLGATQQLTDLAALLAVAAVPARLWGG